MAIIEIAHGHITVADLNDGHTPSIDVGADGRLVIDGVPKGPSLKGEDAEAVARYEIQPSDNSIMRDFKGVLTPATLTARVFRDTGIAMEEVTPGGSNVLRYSIDGGTEQTYSPASGIATGSAKQKITLNFYVGAVRRASLDVPVHGIRAQLDSSGNLTIGEAVVNVKGPKPVLSLNAQHQLVADGELVSSTVLKGADGITPEIDPTTKRWKIGGTLTQVKAEGTDGQPGTPGTPGKDFKYTDFTAAQLDALQSGVKSKIDTSSFRSDIKTLLKGDSAFVAATKGDPGTPGTDGQPGTPGKDFKYTDFTAAQLDALQSGVKSKIDTSAFRSDIKTLLKGDSAFVAATKGATGAQGFGVKVVEWVGSTTLATAKGWVGDTHTYTCKSSDTLTSLRVGDTVHILTVLSDQGSKKGYVVGTCSQKSGTQVSVASVEAFIFGDKGDTGPQGPKGDKPIVTLGTDGYLVIDGTKQSTLLKGKDGKDGANGTNGKDFKYTDFTAAQLDTLMSGVKSKIDTSTFRSDIGGLIKGDVKTLLKGDSAFVAATKGDPGTPGAGYSPNLLENSKNVDMTGADNSSATRHSSSVVNGSREVNLTLLNTTNPYRYVFVQDSLVKYFEAGKTYTLSADVKSNCPCYVQVDSRNSSHSNRSTICAAVQSTGNVWRRISASLTMPSSISSNTNALLSIGFQSGAAVGNSFSVRNICIVEGKGTEWVPTASEMLGTNGAKVITLTAPASNTSYYPYKGSFANWTTWCNNPNENWAAGNTADVAVGDTVLVRGIITDLDNTECQCIGTCVSKKNTSVQVKTVSFIYGKKGADGQTFRPSFSGEALTFTASTDTSAVSLSGIASKTFVEGKGYQTQANVDSRINSIVPAWSRASSKPSYSYTEITGRVTKVSELTNDSGYKTELQINTIINGKGFATTSALNSVQSSIPTKVSQLSNDANYTRERLIANRGDFQHIVILLWKDAELAAHRIQGKLFTTGGGASRHQVVDLDLWFSRWNSSGYDYSFRFDTYGQATPFELVTCTYQGATWWGIRHTSSQAIAIYFQGTDSGVSWNTVHYYTSNTNAVANSEINSSILSKSALVYNIVNKVGAKLDTATFNTEKTALQNSIAAKTDLATVKANCYVKTEIDTKVSTLNTAIGTKLTQAQVDARVTSIVPAWARATAKPGYSFSELTGSATAAQIPNLNASKITAGTLGADRIPTLAIAKVSGLQTALDGKTTLAAVKTLGYKDEAGVKALLTWSNVSSKPTLFSGKYSDLTGKPTIPSKVSELTNDSGYLYLSNGCVTDTAGTCSVLPYAAKSHTHTGYASSSHNHDTVYAAKSHKHNAIEATYSGSGGKQPPNYIGYNSLRSCMSNEEVNGNTQYKNWIYINAYSGADVGGTTAIGFNRQTMAAYLMRSEANASTWAEKAELLGTHNLLSFIPKVAFMSEFSFLNSKWSLSSSGILAGGAPTITTSGHNLTITMPAAWFTHATGKTMSIYMPIVTPISACSAPIRILKSTTQIILSIPTDCTRFQLCVIVLGKSTLA